MKKILPFTMLLIIVLQACSGDESNDLSQSENQIVGVWNSWKEVTDEGETFSLIENGCPSYVDTYNADGGGKEQYFFDCEEVTSDMIKWKSLGDSKYKISSPDGSVSEVHKFTFIDADTFIQRDEENQSDIYFRRSTPSQDPIIGRWSNEQDFIDGVPQNSTWECSDVAGYTFYENGTTLSHRFQYVTNVGCQAQDSFQGTWVNNGNNNYTTKLGVNPEQNYTITFEGVTMTIIIDEHTKAVFTRY